MVCLYVLLIQMELRHIWIKMDLLSKEEYQVLLVYGGGAVVMKNFGSHDDKNISYILDVKANAKGYEQLATMELKGAKRLA